MKMTPARTPSAVGRRMATATIPQERRETEAPWYTREAEEQDIRGGIRRDYERIAPEDSTLLAGVPAEEVLASVAQGWAVDRLVADACYAYQARKHAPHLLESDDLPQE